MDLKTKDLAKIAKKLKNSLNKMKNVKNIKIIGTMTAVVLILSFTYIYSVHNRVYNVKTNGKVIGQIKDMNTYNTVYEAIKNTDGEKAANNIIIERVKDSKDKFLKPEEMEKIIRKNMNLKVPALAVYANGVEMVKVNDKKTADAAIEGLKKLYYPKMGKDNYSIISCEIEGKITTKNVYAKKDEILDVDDAIEKIENGKQSNKIYTIKEGDTIWDISLKNDIGVEDIESANSNINIDKIKPGDQIKIGAFVPYVNVKIKANVNTKEQVPYNVATVYDKKVAKGLKKVKRPGRNGTIDVKKYIEILNGDVVSENVLKTTTVAGVIDEIVIIGNKVPAPTYSYAGFMRPSRGRLSSSFGRRWGRMHSGIDLAAPTGTPIYAANSGRVVSAGWKSGYGKCILISHGGGYQTLYGHSSRLYVKSGQMVKKGQKIAAVGSTGRSTGPHLHFEVRKNGSPSNPIKYIK